MYNCKSASCGLRTARGTFVSTGMEEDQQLGILVKQNIVVDRGTNGALNALVDYNPQCEIILINI